ncbi:methionyl-tRNA formyltransferase [Motiliproteus coralliicola]|uniref:Methionyl-tRNA formyltransferase n=2 Tax=Motiliproteus coralliicola TaxID=2283196 RepID=A0A369WP96_9GAMM|nr:methionyl-tRNA formyltransferase [Motiliproteus coralliicola]
MNKPQAQTKYVVATIKSWNHQAFDSFIQELPGEWMLLKTREELNLERLEEINPRYIFFPHWSWIVPEAILNRFECVCFHMTDVPYGRGGSPLQNLIARGHTSTQLTALRMVNELDAGPVYGKIPFSLEGRAEEIFKRVATLCYDHIRNIVEQEPQPVPQSGEPVCFPRRTPDLSVLPEHGEVEAIYDHIRMLDAEGYPKAFLDHGDFQLQFSHAELEDGVLSAQVTITRKLKQ